MSWFGISLGLSIVLPQMLELYEQVLPFPFLSLQSDGNGSTCEPATAVRLGPKKGRVSPHPLQGGGGPPTPIQTELVLFE